MGRAPVLHLRTGDPGAPLAPDPSKTLTACGLWAAPERSTDDTGAVTCKTCLKSFRYYCYHRPRKQKDGDG